MLTSTEARPVAPLVVRPLSAAYLAELRTALAHWDAIVLDHWAVKADRAHAARNAHVIRGRLRTRAIES